jgi:Cd2+/Zn2+-exporting ATPase
MAPPLTATAPSSGAVLLSSATLDKGKGKSERLTCSTPFVPVSSTTTTTTTTSTSTGSSVSQSQSSDIEMPPVVTMIPIPIVAATATATAYHPQYMFCGECVTCGTNGTGTGNDNKNDNNGSTVVVPPPLNVMARTYLNRLNAQGAVTGGVTPHRSNGDGNDNGNDNKSTAIDIDNNNGNGNGNGSHSSLLSAIHAPLHVSLATTGAPVTSTNATVVRSQFHVSSGLCCSSEVPVIRDLLMRGMHMHPAGCIKKVMVNAATKLVFVDHVHDCGEDKDNSHSQGISALDISAFLTDQGFETTIRRDGGAEMEAIQAQAQQQSQAPSATAIDMDRNASNHHFLEQIIKKNDGNDEDDNDNDRDSDADDDDNDEELALDLLVATPRIRWNVILSGIFWIVSMMSVLPYGNGILENCKYAGLISMVFGLPPVIKKAWNSLKRGCQSSRCCCRLQIDSNGMMVLAAVGAACLGEFDEAASVSFLFSISEWLESRATLRAQRALGSIVTLKPETAHLIVVNHVNNDVDHNNNDNDNDGGPSSQTNGQATTADGDDNTNSNSKSHTNNNNSSIRVVPAASVAVGSLVLVKQGSKVPTDGIVVEGSSNIDESSLTGEATPVKKSSQNNSHISGGTINVGPGPLVVRTTARVEDSAVSRLIQMVEEAQTNRSPTEVLVDRFAAAYTPFILLLALLMTTLPWLYYLYLIATDVNVGMNGDVDDAIVIAQQQQQAAALATARQWMMNALVVVVLACPCALTISTPVTYAAGLAATAQRGIIIKGGKFLESLGRVNSIIFDKTGTLTQGRFRLERLVVMGNGNGNRNTGNNTSGGNTTNGGKAGYNKTEVLTLLALMERNASHPLASTLVQAALDEGINLNTSSSSTGTGNAPNNNNNAPNDLKQFKLSNHLELEGEGIQATLHVDVPVVQNEEHDDAQQITQSQHQSQHTQQALQCYVGNVRLMKRLGYYDGNNGRIPDGLKQEIDKWTQSGGTVGFLALGNGGDESGDGHGGIGDDTDATTDANTCSSNNCCNASNGNSGNGSIIAAFCVMDSVRKEARQVIQILKTKYHCDITLLTGDSLGAAHSIAQQAGMNHCHDNADREHDHDVVAAQLLPEDKLRYVNDMVTMQVQQGKQHHQQQHRRVTARPGTAGTNGLVLFCGDGVNDAPAMAAADVGVAMGSGAAVAMEMSDITLMETSEGGDNTTGADTDHHDDNEDDDPTSHNPNSNPHSGTLHKLVYCMEIGQRVLRTIKENIAITLVSKLVVVILTFMGKTTLFMAIASDVGVMLLVTLNGMKLLPPRENNRQRQTKQRRASRGGVLYSPVMRPSSLWKKNHTLTRTNTSSITSSSGVSAATTKNTTLTLTSKSILLQSNNSKQQQYSSISVLLPNEDAEIV